MRGAQDILGVEETECVFTGTFHKVESIKPSRLPARSVLLVKFVVSHPQDVHFPGLASQTGMQDLDSEYSQDLGILVWVDVSLRESHDVGVCPGIQGLRFASTIICCVIDSHCIVEVEFVLEDDQLRMLLDGERAIGRVTFLVEQASEDVVFEFRNELLCGN